MPRLRLFLVSALAALGAASALGQPEFKVSPATETMLEGGIVNILVIQSGDDYFDLQVPKGYGAQIRQSEESIVFTSETGSSVITVKMSTNYPGALPKMEQLRGVVVTNHPTATLAQTSFCYTSFGAGQQFDLFQPVGGNLTMRLRDAYVSFPHGSFEFILSCDNREYDRNRFSFAWLLNSFRLRAGPAKKNP
jgi:hypothetical protein